MLTGIIDYGAGNLRSVWKAVESQGFDARIVRDPAELDGLHALILPGVGAFGDCARNLERQELTQPVRDWTASGRPYLGICLGYQILFESSEESPGVEGLGILAGRVIRFPDGDLKVPHMGWNEIETVDPSDPLWAGLPPHPHVYFVHSFYPSPDDPSIVAARANYGVRFAAAIRRGNLCATQFHPEKSQTLGLRILRNFLEQTATQVAPS